jgi:hypothetical protein
LEGRFSIILWLKVEDINLLCVRSISPVVVGGNESSTRIPNFEEWIHERVGYSRRGQGRANGTHDYGGTDGSAPGYDETTNQDVITGLNKTARTDVEELMGRRLDGNELRIVKVTAENDGSHAGGTVPQGRARSVVADDDIASTIQGQAVGLIEVRGERALRSIRRKLEDSAGAGIGLIQSA